MKTALFIMIAFVAIVSMIFFPWLLFIIGGIGFFLWLIYDIVKSAVKAALREYDKEKAEANGQK